MAKYQTYQTVGIREDIADIIYSISPTETPFMSGVGKTKATNTLHQWQTDALAPVAANAQAEGATITYPTLSPTVKLGNPIFGNSIEKAELLMLIKMKAKVVINFFTVFP